jgi:hypothetical protein
MIRYFRNEVTNLETKYLALEAAARFGDKETLAKILLTLAGTERNFTIKKDEKLILETIKEEDSRLFDKTVDRVMNIAENLSKVKPSSTKKSPTRG